MGSGIGKIGNLMAVPYFQKFVLTGPITSANNFSLKADLKKEQRLYEAVSKLQLNESVWNLFKLLYVVAMNSLLNYVGWSSS